VQRAFLRPLQGNIMNFVMDDRQLCIFTTTFNPRSFTHDFLTSTLFSQSANTHLAAATLIA
jgi:hypothetical protein